MQDITGYPVSANTLAAINKMIDNGTIDDFNDVCVSAGADGLGNPRTSKGLQQVIFADGTFILCSYQQALEHAAVNADYAAMIDVSALRAALRQALN